MNVRTSVKKGTRRRVVTPTNVAITFGALILLVGLVLPSAEKAPQTAVPTLFPAAPQAPLLQPAPVEEIAASPAEIENELGGRLQSAGDPLSNVAIVKMEALIKEVPTLLGGLDLPATKNEVQGWEREFIEALMNQNGQEKVAQLGSTAWKFQTALADASFPEQQALAAGGLRDLIIAIHSTAVSNLEPTESNMAWLANASVGLATFGDFVVENYPQGRNSTATDLANDILNRFQTNLQNLADRQLYLESLQQPGELTRLEPLAQVQAQPAPKTASPSYEVPSAPLAEMPADLARDVAEPLALVEASGMGITWSEIPLLWTVRNIYDALTGAVEWDSLPGIRTWHVLAVNKVWVVPLWSGAELSVNAIFLGESPNTLAEEMKKPDFWGLPGVYALKRNASWGKDSNGETWLVINSLWEKPRNLKKGDAIMWAEISGLLVDMTR